jgi:hypothetical protein
VNILDLLLKKGADVHAVDSCQLNALSVAVKAHQEDAMRLLFGHMFKIDTTGWFEYEGFYDGSTLLHYAAMLGHESGLKALLKSGADPDVVDNWGTTAMDLAAIQGQHRVVTILLGEMKVPKISSHLQCSPLHFASKWGREETVNVLIGAAKEHALTRDALGFLPLHWAIIGGHVGVIKQLLGVSAFHIVEEVNIPSPLQLALWGGQEDVVDVVRDYFSLTVYADDSRYNIPSDSVRLDEFQSLAREVPLALSGAYQMSGVILVCDHYGLLQLRKGRFRCASAWFDLALMLHPKNKTIQSSDSVVFHKKACNNCKIHPIVGTCYTCVHCIGPCYDLCTACFKLHHLLGHPHDQFLTRPRPSHTLPGLVELFATLQQAMQDEYPKYTRP